MIRSQLTSRLRPSTRLLPSSSYSSNRIFQPHHVILIHPLWRWSSSLTPDPTKSGPIVKPSLWSRFKHELVHYKNGSVLLAKEVSVSSSLLWRLLQGENLTRRERRQLRRTSTDLFRLVPFLVFIIVPFMEFLLPVALKLFPNMLPSTFEDAIVKEEKRRKLLKVRLEMAKFLRETITEPKSEHATGSPQAIKEFSEFIQHLRISGHSADTTELLRVAKLFEDDITLDNLSRPQLLSICRYMGLNAFGTDEFLRYLIRSRMEHIRSDDRLINAEGVKSLTVPELIHACNSRGIRTIGISPGRLRSELEQWLELSLVHKVPSTLLILSRAFSLLDPQTAAARPTDTAEALQATLSSLSEELVAEVELSVGEKQGVPVDSKRKLEVIREQEELIEEEREQRERDEKAYIAAEKEAEKQLSTSSEQNDTSSEVKIEGLSNPDVSSETQNATENATNEKSKSDALKTINGDASESMFRADKTQSQPRM